MSSMQDCLDDEQLQKLENTLYIQFHGLKLQEECTQLVTSESHWEKILRLFVASKRLENCSEGTISRYTDCVTKLIQYLHKHFQDITTNDIRYYLAMYQEQRKISVSYLNTIRRYLSSFFGWLSDEGFINKNPMRRLKHMKVPQKIKKPFTSAEMMAYLLYVNLWMIYSGVLKNKKCVIELNRSCWVKKDWPFQ